MSPEDRRASGGSDTVPPPEPRPRQRRVGSASSLLPPRALTAGERRSSSSGDHAPGGGSYVRSRRGSGGSDALAPVWSGTPTELTAGARGDSTPSDERRSSSHERAGSERSSREREAGGMALFEAAREGGGGSFQPRGLHPRPARAGSDGGSASRAGSGGSSGDLGPAAPPAAPPAKGVEKVLSPSPRVWSPRAPVGPTVAILAKGFEKAMESRPEARGGLGQPAGLARDGRAASAPATACAAKLPAPPPGGGALWWDGAMWRCGGRPGAVLVSADEGARAGDGVGGPARAADGSNGKSAGGGSGGGGAALGRGGTGEDAASGGSRQEGAGDPGAGTRRPAPAAAGGGSGPGAASLRAPGAPRGQPGSSVAAAPAAPGSAAGPQCFNPYAAYLAEHINKPFDEDSWASGTTTPEVPAPPLAAALDGHLEPDPNCRADSGPPPTDPRSSSASLSLRHWQSGSNVAAGSGGSAAALEERAGSPGKDPYSAYLRRAVQEPFGDRGGDRGSFDLNPRPARGQQAGPGRRGERAAQGPTTPPLCDTNGAAQGAADPYGAFLQQAVNTPFGEDAGAAAGDAVGDAAPAPPGGGFEGWQAPSLPPAGYAPPAGAAAARAPDPYGAFLQQAVDTPFGAAAGDAAGGAAPAPPGGGFESWQAPLLPPAGRAPHAGAAATRAPDPYGAFLQQAVDTPFSGDAGDAAGNAAPAPPDGGFESWQAPLLPPAGDAPSAGAAVTRAPDPYGAFLQQAVNAPFDEEAGAPARLGQGCNGPERPPAARVKPVPRAGAAAARAPDPYGAFLQQAVNAPFDEEVGAPARPGQGSNGREQPVLARAEPVRAGAAATRAPDPYGAFLQQAVNAPFDEEAGVPAPPAQECNGRVRAAAARVEPMRRAGAAAARAPDPYGAFLQQAVHEPFGDDSASALPNRGCGNRGRLMAAPGKAAPAAGAAAAKGQDPYGAFLLQAVNTPF